MSNNKTDYQHFTALGSLIMGVSFFLPWVKYISVERTALELFKWGLQDSRYSDLIIFIGIPISSCMLLILYIILKMSKKLKYILIPSIVLTMPILLVVNALIFDGRVAPTLLVGFFLFHLSVFMIWIGGFSSKTVNSEQKLN